MTRTGKRMRRLLALLVVTALFAGMLLVGNPTVSKAAVSASEKTAQVGYGLNNPRTDADGVTTWDCVWFGNYWQEDTNGDGKADKNDAKTPIKWRVLSVDGDDAFLLVDQNLDVQRYNDTRTDVTWETCTMRSWLNGYGADANIDGKDYSGSNFFTNAFSGEEQEAIRTTNIVNEDNPEYDTEGGNDTQDKVYLLSINEVTNPAYGFTSSMDTREAVNTDYVADGGEIKSRYMDSAGSAGWWWLRSPGDDGGYASVVYGNGHVYRGGDHVDSYDYATRVALHINLKASSDALSASSWSYAGIVSSNRENTGTASPTPGAKLSETGKPGFVPIVTVALLLLVTMPPLIVSAL